MDPDLCLRVLRYESDALAAAAASSLDRTVTRYPDWTVADLVVHTGRIHRWVTEIVQHRATERIRQAHVDPRRDPDGLVSWFIAGSEALAAVLTATEPTTAVWTFAGDHTAGFWRRRMALETTIHRWDAQQAISAPDPIAPNIAAEGVDEALHVYMEPRLIGAQVDGDGRCVGLGCADVARSWTLCLQQDAVRVDDGIGAVDARIEGSAADLWLFLMGRADIGNLEVTGHPLVVDACQRAVEMLPVPSH